VWGDAAGAVVGMIVSVEQAWEARTAYMLPVEVLERSWTPLGAVVGAMRREAPVEAARPDTDPESAASGPTDDTSPPARADGRGDTEPRAAEQAADRLAGYSSDDIDDVDRLGITRDVHTIAALLASNKISPPLSVGLFGDWGSGKSFFMRHLERRITTLAAAARTAEAATPPQPSYYCSHIVQITFNAWHYVEANLWASLVTRVFEGLDEQLVSDRGRPSEEYQNLLRRLETSRTLLQEAEQARDAAEAALAQAEELRDRQRRARPTRTVAELASQHPEVAAAADELADILVLDSAMMSLGEIQQLASELRGLGGRFRLGWRALDARPGGWSRRRLGAILAGAAVLLIGGLVWLLQNHRPAAAAVSLAASIVTAVAGISSALLRRSADALRAANRVLKAEDPAVVAAQRTVDERLEQVRRYEQQIEALRRMEPLSVYRFVSERYTSADYRQHLGVVALIQRDFRALSELLVGHPTARAGGRDDPVPHIERIVLYIDDLDRCPPDKVVQVLQAVHLLLAFPLFVVVVGVDSRWLLRSLRREYATVLMAADPEAASTAETDYWASTPQSYLDKIFQISYWLRPMERVGFGALVRSLLDEPDRAVADGAPGTRLPDAAPVAEHGNSAVVPPDPAGDLAPPADTTGPELLTKDSGQDSEAVEVDLTPRMLLIGQREREFIEALAPFIRTPRAAKRLVNVYRLLKVSAGPRAVAALEGDQEVSPQHQAVLLLLGVMIGFPGHATMLFQALRRSDARAWSQFVEELRPQPWDDSAAEAARSEAFGALTAAQAASWRRLCEGLDEVLPSVTLTDLEPFRAWLGAVGRFSFGTGRLLMSA
jgi:hypothetical protein